MYKALKGTIIALGLAGSTFAMANTASADSTVITTTTAAPADVAFGYQDGYWDHSHQWHTWQDQNQMTVYRTSTDSHYNDWNHDRDPDLGWHQ